MRAAVASFNTFSCGTYGWQFFYDGCYGSIHKTHEHTLARYCHFGNVTMSSRVLPATVRVTVALDFNLEILLKCVEQEWMLGKLVVIVYSVNSTFLSKFPDFFVGIYLFSSMMSWDSLPVSCDSLCRTRE